MKTFFTDELFSERDFEKLLLGFLVTLTIVIILLVYWLRGTVDSNLVYLSAIELTAFVARKGLSYIKPDRYYQNTYGDNELEGVIDLRSDTDETDGEVPTSN